MSGPVDAADVYERWRAGKHTQLFGTSYLMQFFDLCDEIGAEAYIITTLPGRYTRKVVDKVVIENRPPPRARGFLYHLAMLWSMCAMAPAMFRFRPNAFVITAHQNYWFALSYVKAWGVEIVPSAHCVLWRPFARTPLHWRLLLWLDGLFLRLLVRHAMAISSVVAEQLRDLAGHGRLEVEVVNPTYARGHFDGCAPPRRGTRPFRILFNGRVEANKGVFDLLEVATRMDRERPGDFLIDVCGEGSDLERLRVAVLERDLGKIVHLHGFCDKEHLGRVLSMAHAVVVPTRSEFEEGLAKSCVEAVLAGRPFVASAVCPAVKSLGEAAIEVPRDDPEAYYAALVALADNDRLYDQKVQACVPLQEQFYSHQRSYKQTLKRILEKGSVLAPVAIPTREPE